MNSRDTMRSTTNAIMVDDKELVLAAETTSTNPQQHDRQKHQTQTSKDLLLTMIPETLFRDEILSYLSPTDIHAIMGSYEVLGPLTLSFALHDHYCFAHGVKLSSSSTRKPQSPIPNNNKNTTNKFCIQPRDPPLEWKQRHPCLHPTRCHRCKMAFRGLEYCRQCELIHSWDECTHGCSSLSIVADVIYLVVAAVNFFGFVILMGLAKQFGWKGTWVSA